MTTKHVALGDGDNRDNQNQGKCTKSAKRGPWLEMWANHVHRTGKIPSNATTVSMSVSRQVIWEGTTNTTNTN